MLEFQREVQSGSSEFYCSTTALNPPPSRLVVIQSFAQTQGEVYNKTFMDTKMLDLICFLLCLTAYSSMGFSLNDRLVNLLTLSEYNYRDRNAHWDEGL